MVNRIIFPIDDIEPDVDIRPRLVFHRAPNVGISAF